MPAVMQSPLADLLTRHWARLHRSCRFAVHDCEVHYLTAMALSAPDDLAAQLLLRKLRMAHRLGGDADRRVVRMNSLVEFVDGCGKTRLACLTHPSTPRTPEHGISIASLLGAGLLGLGEGQEVLWPDRTGEMHPLKVNRIGRSAIPAPPQNPGLERKNHHAHNNCGSSLGRFPLPAVR